jgi:hypothetical protein
MKPDYEKHVAIANALLNGADERGGAKTPLEIIAAAQVHATLALAAATRFNRSVTVREDRP